MKKIILIILVLCQLTAIASCADDTTLSQQEPASSLITANTDSTGSTGGNIDNSENNGNTDSTGNTGNSGGIINSNDINHADIAGTSVGKLAIITTAKSRDAERHSVQPILEKYGTDRILHVTWPGNFMDAQAQMVELVDNLSADESIKFVISAKSCRSTRVSTFN